ncbi:MAG: hypothetical protein SGJ20_00745 [Planctomycetota bacterium]|nr:hypothetical protein [Planctomycetota bacterium]
MAKKAEKQKPVYEVRLGRIKAAIWANETEKGVRYNVTICRLYKDDNEDTWKNSSSFGRDDLLLASKVLDRAHSWILATTTPKQQQPAAAGTKR